jgi:hypothetical protein
LGVIHFAVLRGGKFLFVGPFTASAPVPVTVFYIRRLLVSDLIQRQLDGAAY